MKKCFFTLKQTYIEMEEVKGHTSRGNMCSSHVFCRRRHIQSEDKPSEQAGVCPYPRPSTPGPKRRLLPGEVSALWDGAGGPEGGGPSPGCCCGQVSLHHPWSVLFHSQRSQQKPGPSNRQPVKSYGYLEMYLQFDSLGHTS